MPKITSWTSKADGTVEEGDTKFYPCDDGTYDIETKNESIGFTLGRDKATQRYTVIVRVDYTSKIEKIKDLIHMGDILVSVNGRIVLEESFADIAMFLQGLIQGEVSRRLKFLNPKLCPVDLYTRRLEISGEIQTDLLGFNCSPQYWQHERRFYASQSSITSQRDMEWVEYLKSIGGADNLKPAGIFKPTKDLKAIVQRGIPVAFRALVWQKISLSSLHRLRYPSTYYATLLERAARGELDKRAREDIEKDVDRTFPEHNYFEPAGVGEAGLRRVLQCFAIHSPDIGYCQSLNFVVGMMLLFMAEEDAFWLLVTIVERLLPADYYSRSMVGTYADQFVLSHIIKVYLPRIHAAFEKHQIQLPLITVQWFMCLFVNSLRPEVALRVWDIFLNEGSKVLFRIAAALLKLNQQKILAAKDAADLFQILRATGKDVVDADVLIAAAYKKYSVPTARGSLSSMLKLQQRSRSRSSSITAPAATAAANAAAIASTTTTAAATAVAVADSPINAAVVGKEQRSFWWPLQLPQQQQRNNSSSNSSISISDVDNCWTCAEDGSVEGLESPSSLALQQQLQQQEQQQQQLAENNNSSSSSSSSSIFRNSISFSGDTSASIRNTISSRYSISSNSNSKSQSFNPRLSTRYGDQGAVPADLTGIGLAHIGPMRNNREQEQDAAAATTAVAAIDIAPIPSLSMPGSPVQQSIFKRSLSEPAYASGEQSIHSTTAPAAYSSSKADSLVPIYPTRDTSATGAHDQRSSSSGSSRDITQLQHSNNSSKLYGSGDGIAAVAMQDSSATEVTIVASNKTTSTTAATAAAEGDVEGADDSLDTSGGVDLDNSDNLGLLNNDSFGSGDVTALFPKDDKNHDPVVLAMVANYEFNLVKNNEYLMIASERMPFENYFEKYPHKMLTKSSKKPVKNGELNFSRADIALWRSSFLPQLEDQHRTMEAARRCFQRESETTFDSCSENDSGSLQRDSDLSSVAAAAATTTTTTTTAAAAVAPTTAAVTGTASVAVATTTASVKATIPERVTAAAMEVTASS